MKSLLLFCCPVPQIRSETENVNFPSAQFLNHFVAFPVFCSSDRSLETWIFCDVRRKQITSSPCFQKHYFILVALFSAPQIRWKWRQIDKFTGVRTRQVESDLDQSKRRATKREKRRKKKKKKKEGCVGRRVRREGGLGSNASLMRLLVVSAVGAWHRRSIVSTPAKICSGCRIQPEPTHRKHTVTHGSPPGAGFRWTEAWWTS